MRQKQQDEFPSSYELIGSRQGAVIVVEIPKGLERRRFEIARELACRHKHVRSVLRKLTPREGEHRLRQYELLYGDPNTEVVHKEHGYLVKLDPKKVYFSPREATERQRIAQQVKEGEFILYLFAGVGPYAWAILHRQPKVQKIVLIDSNPWATRYAAESAVLNKVQEKVIIVKAGVKEVCHAWYGCCDRVLMPLLNAEEFLEVGVRCAKPGGVIHFYSWGPESDPFTRAMSVIKKVVENFEILDQVEVLPIAPRTVKVCIDFKLS